MSIKPLLKTLHNKTSKHSSNSAQHENHMTFPNQPVPQNWTHFLFFCIYALFHPTPSSINTTKHWFSGSINNKSPIHFYLPLYLSGRNETDTEGKERKKEGNKQTQKGKLMQTQSHLLIIHSFTQVILIPISNKRNSKP